MKSYNFRSLIDYMIYSNRSQVVPGKASLRLGLLYFIFLSILLWLGLACHPEKSTRFEIIQPKLLNSHTALRYPAEASMQKIQGKAIIRTQIGKDGQVMATQIHKSSGHEMLDQAALEMAKILVFEPGKINGVPRELWVLIPFDFKLDNDWMVGTEIETWWGKTQDYFSRLSSDSTVSRNDILQYIFYHYQSMVNYVGDSRSLQANDFILNIVSDPIRQHWLEFEKIWPLGFLLYLDYEDRFPNSPYAKILEDELVAYLNRETKLLETQRPPPLKYAELYQSLSTLLKKLYDKSLIK